MVQVLVTAAPKIKRAAASPAAPKVAEPAAALLVLFEELELEEPDKRGVSDVAGVELAAPPEPTCRIKIRNT